MLFSIFKCHVVVGGVHGGERLAWVVEDVGEKESSVREVFVVHVGGARCVPSSTDNNTDNIMNIQCSLCNCQHRPHYEQTMLGSL